MIPLFSVEQVREVDNYSINTLGIPGILLMENASQSIFNIITKEFPELSFDMPVGFVCGKGNNGGDGFAVARHFLNHGFKVKVVYISDGKELTGDALSNFNMLNSTLKISAGSVMKKFSSPRDLKVLDGCSIIVDAILGSGAKGILKEPYSTIIKELNKKESARIAVDIPTGLDADTGFGDTIFNADVTVCLAELKRGLYINKGASHSGKIVKGYIGAPENYFDQFEVDEYLIEPEDIVSLLPRKPMDLYKYSAGKVLVIAGSKELPGASVLTSTSVLKSGAGACFLCLPSSVKAMTQPMVSEVIINSYEDEATGILRQKNVEELKKRFDWMDVLAIGPGLGRNEDTQSAVKEIIKLNGKKKIVLDADAIFALGNDEYRYLDHSRCVFTPHHAEFAHLLGISLSELQQDVLKYGKQFTADTGSHLVLKGAPTIIFNPAGEAFINSTGNPAMAKFGTGDVLTGILAGFLAQSDGIEQAVLTSVYLHSLSADLLLKDKTEYGIMATDIIDNLPAAINFLRKSCV